MDADSGYDDFEPLECAPLPVAIEACDVEIGGPATVRLFFRGPGGRNLEPGGALSDVVFLEQWDRVAIALVQRVVSGDLPDGTVYGGELLIRGNPFSLDVVLREPLGTSAVPLPAEAEGTPRWIS